MISDSTKRPSGRRAQSQLMRIVNVASAPSSGCPSPSLSAPGSCSLSCSCSYPRRWRPRERLPAGLVDNVVLYNVTGETFLVAARYARRRHEVERFRVQRESCPVQVIKRCADVASGWRSCLRSEHLRAAHLLSGNRIDHSVGEVDRLGRDLDTGADDAPETPGMHEQVERWEAQAVPMLRRSMGTRRRGWVPAGGEVGVVGPFRPRPVRHGPRRRRRCPTRSARIGRMDEGTADPTSRTPHARPSSPLSGWGWVNYPSVAATSALA